MTTPFSTDAYYKSCMDEHVDVIHATRDQLGADFARWVDDVEGCLLKGGKLMLMGNGGSAADAQHIATELTVRFGQNRRAMAALALTTDTSALTAIGNDLGYVEIFARQIEALGRPEDHLIGITTSGNSPNILRGLEQARAMGIQTSALTNQKGGVLAGKADHILYVPSTTTARVQEMHILLAQMLCGALELKMGYVA